MRNYIRFHILDQTPQNLYLKIKTICHLLGCARPYVIIRARFRYTVLSFRFVSSWGGSFHIYEPIAMS